MSERPALAPKLRAFDQAAEQRGMPLGARARVASRLRREAQRRDAVSGFRFRWLPAVTFAAGAALVLVVVGFGLRGDLGAELTETTPPVMGMFTARGEDCHHHEVEPDTVFDGECRLVGAGLDVHTWDRVRMREDDHAVRVLEGTALFEAEPVPAEQPPRRIYVSHGRIEVVGTRFTIEQGPRGGHVDLFEGRIRFVSLDEVVTEIEPGQRHRWGEMIADNDAVAVDGEPGVPGSSIDSTDDAEHGAGVVLGADVVPMGAPEPSPATAEAKSRRASGRRGAKAGRTRSTGAPGSTTAGDSAWGTADEAAAIIDEVAALRKQGRYVEAAAVLRRADRARRWDRRTAQVLSYELGEIMARHLGDREAACAHWVRHRERFEGGRYARAVANAVERLGCEPAAKP